MDRKLALLAFLITALSTPVSAKDYGTYGALFPIIEPSILDTINQRLEEMKDLGELEQMQDEFEATTRAYVNRPKPVLGLQKTDAYRAFEVDLSITVETDLADQNGRIFARRGTVVNPLAYSRFNKAIIVFDGDDPAQVAFALSEGNELDTLLVLVDGEPLELTRIHGRRFWFDQQGVITNKFQIERLPSVITRADPVMLVEEIPLGE
ncbi:type-F conjugative transfer system protein TraW [Rhodobacterales bacterium 52_120_T64]|nr:type-F conjugative transfer system protein TraW [Rhodobacterales bacterium 52_120_T64]